MTQDEFHKKALRWENAVGVYSHLSVWYRHPIYLEILEMGAEALPLILRELRRSPTWWFDAIITICKKEGIEPPSYADIGSMANGVKTTLEWGYNHGYLDNEEELYLKARAWILETHPDELTVLLEKFDSLAVEAIEYFIFQYDDPKAPLEKQHMPEYLRALGKVNHPPTCAYRRYLLSKVLVSNENLDHRNAACAGLYAGFREDPEILPFVLGAQSNSMHNGSSPAHINALQVLAAVVIETAKENPPENKHILDKVQNFTNFDQ